MIEQLQIDTLSDPVNNYPNQPELDPERVAWNKLLVAVGMVRRLGLETPETPQEDKNYADMDWYRREAA